MARDGARQGDIFTAAIGVEFREVLRLEMDADTWAAIMDDNPGEFSNRINGDVSRPDAVIDIPPNILARLPRLPEDVQYRFVGRHLILLDTRANLIPSTGSHTRFVVQTAISSRWSLSASPRHEKCRRSPVSLTTSCARSAGAPRGLATFR